MSTFMGLAVPIFSDTGIELIAVSSTGGIEFKEYVTLSGGETISGALTLSGSLSAAVGMTSVISSTTQSAGFTVSITSTGALAAGVSTVNGFVVNASSKSVLNSVVTYNCAGDANVCTAQAFLTVNGTKAPTNFLVLGNSGNVGAAESNGFFSITHRLTSSASISTITAFATIAVMSGTYVFYIPCYPNTMIT